MTSDAIIAVTAAAEPWIAAGSVALAIVLAWRGMRGVAQPTLDERMAPRTEALLLALVVAVSIALRTVGWDDALTPPFWFSEIPTLQVERMLDAGTVWPTWLQLFRTTQVGWAHESVTLLPLIATLQQWLGPRFGLPVLAGAVAGTIAVVLAWLLGRRMRSQAFGLVLAALVAVSPLELAWSRLGPYYVAAVPHVLFAMLAGWVAGQRASVLLAAAAGLVAWTNLYAYYPARVGIPLGALAVLAGTSRWTSAPRRMALLVAWGLAFVGVGVALSPGSVAATFWPSYGGYAGNNGERNLVEFLTRNFGNFAEQSWIAPERYFMNSRSVPSMGYEPGVGYGGLCLFPTTILGVIGLGVVVARRRTQWLWVLVAAAGLALPIISVTTARRLLVLDLAWCAFAAHGLLAVVETIAAAMSRRTRGVLVGGAIAAIGAWGALAVLAVSAALPSGSNQPIPFGESGFGDGTTCKRCLEAAKVWQRDIASGGFVVLFDNDQVRENRTSPGGLEAYGKIAASLAGKRTAFLEGYGLLAGWDGEMPTPGALFNEHDTDFVGYLVRRMDRVTPERIVWHFERPTRWEQWLVTRLERAGGVVESFPTPLSPTPGLRVVTDWSHHAEAIAVLRDLAAGLRSDEDTACVDFLQRGSFTMNGPVLLLSPRQGGGAAAPPEWLGTSWVDVRLGARKFEFAMAVGAIVPSAQSEPIALVGEFGRRVTIDQGSGEVTVLPDEPVSAGPGLNCAAYAGGRWWSVDPMAGRIASADPTAPPIGEGQWIAAARDGDDGLVLAAADQALARVDARGGGIVQQFPAHVSPSVRVGRDECSQIAVGDDWIATVDLRLAILHFYARDGRPLGTKSLDFIRRTGETLTAVAGAGRFLGLGTNTGTVRTIEIVVRPDCTPTRD